MVKLRCPRGCKAGFTSAHQTVINGVAKQRAYCAKCNTLIETSGGTEMGSVGDMTQNR